MLWSTNGHKNAEDPGADLVKLCIHLGAVVFGKVCIPVRFTSLSTPVGAARDPGFDIAKLANDQFPIVVT